MMELWFMHSLFLPVRLGDSYIYWVTTAEQQEPNSFGSSFCVINLCRDEHDRQRERIVLLCFTGSLQVFLYYDLTSSHSYFHFPQTWKRSVTS